MKKPQNGRKRTTHKTLWLASFILWIALLLTERLLYSDTFSCELPGLSSFYGTPGWSWIPLGHTCTWDNLGGFTVVDAPTMMTMFPPMLLTVWAAAIFLSRRGAA